MTYEFIILAAAKAAKVSGTLLLAICTHESGLKNVYVPHDGGSPTYGICQVKLPTAQMMGFKGEAKDLMIPEINAKWAAIYLKYQIDRYDKNLCKATAAYNAGKFNKSKNDPQIPRNLKYVRKIQSKIDKNFYHILACGDKK
jgi:soluble lytic murein transglycosylase-like protein